MAQAIESSSYFRSQTPAGTSRSSRCQLLASRAWVLSDANPSFHCGHAVAGIGSPHTPGRRVWPLSLAIQGLTSPDQEEKVRLARAIASTLSTSGHVHESVHVDDPTDTTRDWFAWGDAAFCELLLDLPAHR